MFSNTHLFMNPTRKMLSCKSEAQILTGLFYLPKTCKLNGNCQSLLVQMAVALTKEPCAYVLCNMNPYFSEYYIHHFWTCTDFCKNKIDKHGEPLCGPLSSNKYGTFL